MKSDLAALTAEVAVLRQRDTALTAEMAALRALVTNSEGNVPATATVAVDPAGPFAAEARRGLSHGSNHVAAIKAVALHEFVDGGTCQPAPQTLFLPTDRTSSSVIWT